MSAHLTRAELLLQQSRPADAEREAGLALAQAPDPSHAHALLALSRLHQGKRDTALEAARSAIACAPDSPYAHYVLALVLHRSDRNRDALATLNDAIRLAPDDADLFTLQSSIHLSLGNWSESLRAAEQALALSPEHVDAANFRSMALVRLGRKTEAMETVDSALQRDPENAFSHANQGWNCLHRNDPASAREHFREALRLDPSLDYAREGMLEALKARNWLYRGVLAYFLWMGRLPAKVQWGVILGAYFGSRVIANLAAANPGQKILWWSVLGVLYGFIYLTWTAQPMFNLFLRLDRFGRHVLSRDQTVASNWFGPFFAAAMAALVWFFVTGENLAFFSMFFLAALSICVAATFVRTGRNRLLLGAGTAALAALALLATTSLLQTGKVNEFALYFSYGFLAFQIGSNFLGTRRE